MPWTSCTPLTWYQNGRVIAFQKPIEEIASDYWRAYYRFVRFRRNLVIASLGWCVLAIATFIAVAIGLSAGALVLAGITVVSAGAILYLALRFLTRLFKSKLLLSGAGMAAAPYFIEDPNERYKW